MPEWRIHFAENLKYLRQKHCLTQVEMAEIAAVCVSTYRKMEKTDPKVRIHAGRVCRIFLAPCDFKMHNPLPLGRADPITTILRLFLKVHNPLPKGRGLAFINQTRSAGNLRR